MALSHTNGNGNGKTDGDEVALIANSFKKSVIDRFSIKIGNHTLNYYEYLSLPTTERSNDEADAVDQRFARYCLEWLGFENEDDWNYNRPQSGQKANRPDYVVHASVGTAFIWEDKNSTIDLDKEHLIQMRRYSIGTAGYAVWCNMRRIFAVRFMLSDTLRYEILTDIAVEQLFDGSSHAHAANLALFRLLFSHHRFTHFAEMADKIAVTAQLFEQRATRFIGSQVREEFLQGSRQSLDHLKLAALAQARKASEQYTTLVEEEKALLHEWVNAQESFISKLGYDHIRKPVLDALQNLTPRIGEITAHEIKQVRTVIMKVVGRSLSVSLSSLFEVWEERATRVNTAFLVLRFQSAEYARVADAYRVWSERQSDARDANPETFAEQVAYVFFIRLLLVRVLEDKHVLEPRLASNGGFDEWRGYVKTHFKELDGIGILNQSFCDIMARKAGYYYLHFFQQAVFDWFTPDDFLLVETLEFLCRYNFQQVDSDIIGFTYENYIDRNARNRKGHFLTQDDVVDYMLDLLEYHGPLVLGRRMLDPACGSGSFLVHAARRYRQALVTALCKKYNQPDEETLSSDAILRKELAQRYLDNLTTLFFGMELNPFACYLAEMNLLIQGLDDLFVLQQGSTISPIERFQIYNTDSLGMPREVLDSSQLVVPEGTLWVPDRLSDRLADEASVIKAKAGMFAQGFFFIISNPPYINASQVALAREYASYPFYAQVLSGATNTYLLFLRLGMYYLSFGGRMIYIVPLTILGDSSATAARQLLQQPPFRPTKVVRFFSGDVLFPGVDQAVSMVRVDKDFLLESETDTQRPDWMVTVSGGYTISETRQNEQEGLASLVFDITPPTGNWRSVWMVSIDANSYAVWEHVKVHAKSTLGELWKEHLEIRKGDIASDHLNPFRLGRNHVSLPGDIAIQKGEDVFRYAPLAKTPSDWARPKTEIIGDRRNNAVNAALLRIQQLMTPEQGITLRKIARLNTRERLIATWFQRDSNNPFVFPDEQWRFRLLPDGDVKTAKAILSLLNSRIVAYLLNLFSTNNNVAQGELARLLVPALETFPVTQLAALTDALLRERLHIEVEIVTKYSAKLPDFDEEPLYLPPSAVLNTTVSLPTISLGGLVMQGVVINKGITTQKIKTLRARSMIAYTGSDEAYTKVLELFLQEPGRENDSWTQALAWKMPDSVAATAWLKRYTSISQQAQQSWDNFVSLQQQVDDIIADWYGLTTEMRDAIVTGLPWARRRKLVSNSVIEG